MELLDPAVGRSMTLALRKRFKHERMSQNLLGCPPRSVQSANTFYPIPF